MPATMERKADCLWKWSKQELNNNYSRDEVREMTKADKLPGELRAARLTLGQEITVHVG